MEEKPTRYTTLTIMKKNVLLNFIKDNEGHSQGELARMLKDDMFFSSLDSARVSIGIFLRQLEKEDLAYYKVRKPVRGFIPKKIWFYGKRIEKNDNISEISRKKQEE